MPIQKEKFKNSFDAFSNDPFKTSTVDLIDSTDDDSHTLDTYLPPGKEKGKKKNVVFKHRNLGDELNDQLVKKKVRTISTQTDWQWKKMALRWRNAKLMHARFLDESDFFEPDQERVAAGNNLLREIAQQLPDLFNIMTYDELQDLSDVLSNVGLKRTDAKTDLVELLNSIPLGSEFVKRLSTSSVTTGYDKRDSMASSVVGRRLNYKLTDIIEDLEGMLSQGMASPTGSRRIPKKRAFTLNQTEKKSKVVPGKTEEQIEESSLEETKKAEKTSGATETERVKPAEPSKRRKQPAQPVKKFKPKPREPLASLFRASQFTENLVLSKLMETDFHVEFDEGTGGLSRGSSIFSDVRDPNFRDSFEKHVYTKKLQEQKLLEDHDDDPSLYLFGHDNKLTDTHDLEFDPYDLDRVW